MPVVNFDLLIKYLSGNATPEEAIAIELWRSASVSNNDYFNEVSEEWNKNNPKPFEKADIDKMWKAFPAGATGDDKQVFPGRKTGWRWIRVAAMLMIILSAGIYFYFSGKENKPGTVSYTANEAKAPFLLPDSSLILLSRGKADYQANKSGRTVHLNGNASFTVKHLENSRFKVKLSCGLVIEDIGTSFNITEYKDSVIVVVTDGTILASDAYAKIPARKYEKITYLIPAKKLYKGEIARDFDFKDATLREIAEAISEDYEIRVELGDYKLENCRLSISSPQTTLSELLQIIENTINVSHIQTGDSIRFYGKGCN